MPFSFTHRKMELKSSRYSIEAWGIWTEVPMVFVLELQFQIDAIPIRPAHAILASLLAGAQGKFRWEIRQENTHEWYEWYYECVDCGLCQNLWLFCLSNSFSTVLDCGICVLWSWARSVGWSDFVELAIVKRAWKLSTGGLWTLWTFGQKYWLTLKFSLQ